MIYYIGFPFVCFLSFLLYCLNRVYFNAFFVLLGIFLCCGYMTGTDWRAYESIYESVSEGGTSLWGTMLFMEPGYVLYNYIGGALHIDFWHFFIFTKAIIYIIFVRWLLAFCPKDLLFLALVFFITWYAYFLFIDNPMRNLIAIGIFLSAYKFMINRRFWPYFCLMLLAVSFHFSAVVMLPLYWLSNKSYRSRNIIIIYVALNIVLLDPRLIYSVLDFFFSRLPLVGAKIEAYSNNMDGDGGGKLFSFGMLVHNVFFILIMLCRRKIEEIPHGKMIFMFSIVYLVLFRLGLTITVMGRFSLYVAVFYSVAIAACINGMSRRSRGIYASYVLLIGILSCITYLTKDSRYIPYTNYLFYPDHSLSYEQRSSYNPENSPYKKQVE